MARRQRATWKPRPEDYRAILSEQNPWHAAGSVPFSLAPPTERAMVSRLVQVTASDNPRRFRLVLGPRRVGKTTVMYQMVRAFLATGVAPHRLWWLRLDHPLLIQLQLGALIKRVISLSQATAADPRAGWSHRSSVVRHRQPAFVHWAAVDRGTWSIRVPFPILRSANRPVYPPRPGGLLGRHGSLRLPVPQPVQHERSARAVRSTSGNLGECEGDRQHHLARREGDSFQSGDPGGATEPKELDRRPGNGGHGRGRRIQSVRRSVRRGWFL